MKNCASVALFVFNRPAHTAATLDALRKNESADASLLSIFCDGPRSAEDEEAVAQVRQIARKARGFKGVQVVERSENVGLAQSVITGVTEMLDTHETVIVVEDDLITSPYFLGFMNEGLQTYAAEERVVSICGYSYPSERPLPETFFLPGAHCWGWATWRRGWALFEPDPHKLLKRLDEEDRIYAFDVGGSYPHTMFLRRTAAGEGDSWALRWMASAIVNDRLTLYPGCSLVQNAGMDDSGTHGDSINVYDTTLAQRRPRLARLPAEPDRAALAQREAFHVAWRSRWSLKNRLYYFVAKLLPAQLEKAVYSTIVRRSLHRMRKP